MAWRSATQAVVNCLAMVLTLFVFGSPIPMILKISSTKTADQFSPTLYLTTLLNCIMWMIYGVSPHNREMMVIYGLGALAEIFFLSVFSYYSSRNLRIKIVAVLVAEGVCTAIVLSIVLTEGFTPENRIFVGILSVLTCVMMYASPFCMLVKTKRENQPFSVSFCSFLNGLLGIISSLMSPDRYILIANFLGVLLSISQLYLYFTYRDEPELGPHVDADRATVDADRAAVDADRVAVDSDRTTVDADRVTVDADRAAVDADRATVDADRATVDADRATVDADRATVDADRATVDADRATVDADRAAVVTDRAAVEADRTSLEADSGRADVVASRAAVVADKVAVVADRIAVVADRIAVVADRIAVMADRAAVEVARWAAAVDAEEDMDNQ